VSHGTFYLYFSNKQDLLRAMAGRCADEMVAVVTSLEPVAPGTAGRATLRSWLDDFLENYRSYGVVIRAWMEDTITDRELVVLGGDTFSVITEALVARIREAGASNVHDPEVAAAALLGLIERFTYFMTSRDLGVSDDEALDALAITVHRGFFDG
jgi:AcrR family transcriptional regulator